MENGPMETVPWNERCKEQEIKESQRSFGNVANMILTVLGRSSMGIHGGRQGERDGLGREGIQHCTMGCIRITDATVKKVVQFYEKYRRLNIAISLKVQNNE